MLGKRGAGDWTVTRLITMILAVVIMVFLALAVKNGMVPNIDRMGEMMDNVVDMLKFKGGGSKAECYVRDAEGFVDGSDFLKNMGIEGAKVEVGICDGICNISGGGIASYQVSAKGGFEKLGSSGWQKWDRFFVGSTEGIEGNWEMYHGGIGMLDKVNLRDSFLRENKFTHKFVLYARGGAGDTDVMAVWQNGKWNVVRMTTGGDKGHDPKSGILFDEFGREVLYSGEDDDMALKVFYNEADDAFDDKVYWKVLNYNKEYDFDVDKGEVIGVIIRDFPKVEELYFAIVKAEHNLPLGFDLTGSSASWIRTEMEEGRGSTAYGPAQLTMGLAKGYLKSSVVWSIDERDYLNRFVEQGCLFLLHGGGKIDLNQLGVNECVEVYKKLSVDENTKYDVRYDYGGVGHLIGGRDKLMYKQIVVKMLKDIYVRQSYDLDAVWREWRFGVGDMNKFRCDKADGEGDDCFGYKNRFYSVLGGGDDELDSDSELAALKLNFARKKHEFLKFLSPPEDGVAELRGKIDGKKIVVEGKSFDVEVVEIENGFVVFFSFESEKFGLKYYPYGKVKSGSVDLDARPFVLVDKDGKVIGNEEYYKLPEREFKEALKATFVKEFLRGICR